MATRRTLIAASVITVAVAGGAIAASARPERPQVDRYGTTALAADLTPAQEEAVAAVQQDTPIPVQDAQGDVRGFVRDSALTARDGRVLDQIVAGFRERNSPVDEEYDELFEALRILDPVPVVDAEGVTVGYWTRNFKEIDELEELETGAQATVDRLLR